MAYSEPLLLAQSMLLPLARNPPKLSKGLTPAKSLAALDAQKLSYCTAGYLPPAAALSRPVKSLAGR